MSPDPLEKIRTVVESIVHEEAPGEDFAFSGVWSDAVANLDAGRLDALPQKGASQFLGGGAELPLLSAVIVPVALWAGRKILDKAADAAADQLVAAIKRLLSAERRHEGGSLSDQDIDRLATALIKRLAKALKEPP